MDQPGNIAIRRADVQDAPAISILLAAAFAAYQPRYTAGGYAATVISSQSVISRIEEGPVWVAALGKSVMGTISVVPRGEALYIRGMAVLPSAHGQGIGKMLLATVEKFALSHGVSLLLLSTTPFLDRAIRLYQNFGFRRTAEGPHDLHGTPLFSMEKLLNADDQNAVAEA